MKRYLESQVRSDLKRKMVFVGGPRQVGKTTLARNLLGKSSSGLLNWDVPAQRDLILRQQILVTGSARLDYYRFGGDLLQGRHHYLPLHPLSVAELMLRTVADFKSLLKLSGFPEPWFGGSEQQARRWSNECRSRIVGEDLVSVEQLQDLGSIELLMSRLPDLVGSPLSINGLVEQMQISHKTLSKWIDVLERLYTIFVVLPFNSPKIKALRKARKHYYYDWSLVREPSFRFENVVASHLL
jgi:uncharacterized protein